MTKKFYSMKKNFFPHSLGFMFWHGTRNIFGSGHPVAASLEWFAQLCLGNIWKLAENFSNRTAEKKNEDCITQHI